MLLPFPSVRIPLMLDIAQNCLDIQTIHGQSPASLHLHHFYGGHDLASSTVCFRLGSTAFFRFGSRLSLSNIGGLFYLSIIHYILSPYDSGLFAPFSRVYDCYVSILVSPSYPAHTYYLYLYVLTLSIWLF